MVDRISIETFLKFTEFPPLVDVRTPLEFESGHIPVASNIPLFSNEERAAVGTVYKRESPEKAMALGHKYVNPKRDSFISDARELAPGGTIAVYCWRGGMRSEAFADHLHENGFNKVLVIEGGYKAYRNYALRSFENPSELNILGGYTGTGKTRILKIMEGWGHQVIDLEGLAHHKGSAFGGIGQLTQPTTEHFANLLFWKWKELDLSRPVWIEDESSNIGKINLPEKFYFRMRESRVFFLRIPKEKRAEILVQEYAACDSESLAYAIERISRKLGGQRAAEATRYLGEGNYYETALITLDYYDKFYLKGLKRRDEKMVTIIESDSIDENVNAKLVMDASTDLSPGA